MTIEQGLFIIFGAITLGAALLVVTRRNVSHAASFLVLSFFSVAGLYVLLEAHFLVAVQSLIGVSGIAILIISPTILKRDGMNSNLPGANRQWWAAALVAVVLCGVLGWVILNHNWTATAPAPVPEDSIAILGKALVDPQGFVLPFGVASVLLLVTLIGAVTIAKAKEQ
ncbi:MAG: NADH-quinone oxidoreductase subunit J [Chloroflexota bacterium]|nr:NADH-quinone oxidoreductase subunit J [Chloroflexota bacterium]